ncbi:MBL fold metallo-hydrolase [Bordetella trematum]|uniref:MBL fold metallo-hydrolase n=1 Tax=Bordetella trematum TaxID=123899 RepID=UPI00046E5C36|nr:MBL fold metallo-hydrolase [Bordetella trematum]
MHASFAGQAGSLSCSPVRAAWRRRAAVLGGSLLSLALAWGVGLPAQAADAARPAAALAAAPGAELVLLGVAGGPTWYGKDSPHGISSALVIDGRAYIVDLGSGAYRQLRRAGIKPGMEQAVFFTHLHTDHVVDLASLLMYDPSARRRAGASLQIFGPGNRGVLPPLAPGMKEEVVIHHENPSAGTRDMVDAIVGAMAADMNIRVRSEGVPDVRKFFQAHDIALPAGLKVDPNTDPAPPMEPFVVWQDPQVKVSATLVPHGLVFPNFAYRFDTAQGSVVFSGDTAVSDNLIRLAKGADILVHEAIDPAWVDHIVGAKPWDARQQALARQLLEAHTTPQQVGEVATRAGVRTLVLSHLVPGDAPAEHWAQARETFAGPVVVGQDLMRLPLGGRP